MSLDDRLRRAREDYRARAATSAPAVVRSLAVRPVPGWRRPAVLSTAAAVAILVVVGGVLLLDGEDDRSESVDVVGPATTTTTAFPDGTVVVPDVTGFLYTVAEAQAILDEAGLDLAVSEGDGDLPDAGVIAQEPPPGAQVGAGGPAGRPVVGVRTSLPPPPAAVDCPAMAANREIAPDAYDAMPPAAGIGLDHVRRLVDGLAAQLAESGSLDAITTPTNDIEGVYVGRGVIPAWDLGSDGELTTTPDVGFQVVVEVAAVEDCPDSASFVDGTPIWFSVGWPSSAEPPEERPTEE